MQDIKTEIDEKTYLKGCPLNQAISKYCTPEAIQNYQSAINSPKSYSSDKFDKTFIGFLNITGEAIQNAQIQKDKIKNAADILYKEIFMLINSGALIPYSYQSPRKLSDLPIRIPIDIFMAGNINWAQSELIYKNFEFTNIRLIEKDISLKEIPLKKTDVQPNSNETSSFKAPFKGIPIGTTKNSFANLDPELHIDEKKAAEYLGLSHRTLQGYRTKGGGPEFIKISHKVVRYKIADLIKWTENKKRKNTSQ